MTIEILKKLTDNPIAKTATTFSLRLQPDQISRVEIIATRLGIPRSKVLKVAIDAGVREIERSLIEIETKNADVETCEFMTETTGLEEKND